MRWSAWIAVAIAVLEVIREESDKTKNEEHPMCSGVPLHVPQKFFLSSQCCWEGLPSLRFMDTVCATNIAIQK